jgi:hypothetical protein
MMCIATTSDGSDERIELRMTGSGSFIQIWENLCQNFPQFNYMQVAVFFFRAIVIVFLKNILKCHK